MMVRISCLLEEQERRSGVTSIMDTDCAGFGRSEEPFPLLAVLPGVDDFAVGCSLWERRGRDRRSMPARLQPGPPLA
jgi:hypothetical protein